MNEEILTQILATTNKMFDTLDKAIEAQVTISTAELTHLGPEHYIALRKEQAAEIRAMLREYLNYTQSIMNAKFGSKNIHFTSDNTH